MLTKSPRAVALLSFTVLLFVLLIYHRAPWTPSLASEQVSRQWQFSTSLFATEGETHKNENNKGQISSTPDDEDAKSGYLLATVVSETPPKPGQKAFSWLPKKGKGKSLIDGIKQEDSPEVEDWEGYMKTMLEWDRPKMVAHWPPYDDYVGRDYDPNRWEDFERDNRIFQASHDKLDALSASAPQFYRPYPKYNSAAYKKKWKGEYVACEGPRGVPLNESTDDIMQVYRGVPQDAPSVFAGGYDVLGLDADVCFDRYSRYGPYGLGDDEHPEEIRNWNAPKTLLEWNAVRWGELQDECLERNKLRYHPEARTPSEHYPNITRPHAPEASAAFAPHVDNSTYSTKHGNKKKYHPRTAVLIRTWTGYQYQPNDIQAIRAVVSELSLQSGGEYTIYLFVHVKDSPASIFTNETIYDEVVMASVPEEFRSMTILWSESIFPEWYPRVGDWQVYWQQFMCLQWFSATHPEFDYIWNWETDARYTGNHYHLLEKISQFADRQPRKGLWERNKRFYIPSVHGTYEEFVEDTHNASFNSPTYEPVWGPRPWAAAQPPQRPLGPKPPSSFEDDNFEWGVSEPADLITLLPIWDPRNTGWSYKDKIWNYIPEVRPEFTGTNPSADGFTHPEFATMDRRVFINTVVRLSKGLLGAMHEENRVGRSMQAEMWPASVALQHGFKAVYAPHPIFADRVWPAGYARAVFDSPGTEAGKSQEERRDGDENVQEEGERKAQKTLEPRWTEGDDSPYNRDREWNFGGMSWYFASRFPRRIYRAWLGWEVEEDGLPVGKVEEGREEKQFGGEEWEGSGKGGRMCLPGMLLHPVKDVRRERVRL